ncbi:proprotein convertase subtilisin/kexin type 7-like [Physella acuta]|uniref:proprotein convertase subtilisin/kexin type 7-like n=1 Tax=Physella acuta TaxID=109671 RepID=UPI0027DAF5E6|nr:proprotein convertase subtilisin/kexin type 7-like [Physella acuta]
MEPDWLLYIMFTISSLILQSESLPLRNLWMEKYVWHPMVESKELMLCWVVQINTLKSCDCNLKICQGDCTFEHADDVLFSTECCHGNDVINNHVQAIATEVGLEIHHAFGHFHDHFVLCHEETSSGKGRSLSTIHELHANFRTSDRTEFELLKANVETKLRQHGEILWFSPEHAHQRNSRLVIPSSTHSPHTKQGYARHTTTAAHTEEVLYIHANLDDLIDPDEEFDETSLFPVSSLGDSKSQQTEEDNSKKRILTSDQLHLLYGHQAVGTLLLNTSSPVLPSVSASSIKKRSLTISFNDPAFQDQWHLLNRRLPGMDINVTGVWQHNITGAGITVCVVDDGVEWKNPDLKLNYNQKGSWDLNNDDPDPSPSLSKLSNHHGTRCAGEIAAVANNNVCAVGVAYGAQFSGLRILDGVMTDSLEAEAFNKKMDINDIYSCSWGPDDNGKTVDGPHLMAVKAMKYGVDFGRQGYGNIFVVASGNGGVNMDNCNFDGYANSIYTVTIGAVDDKGKMPYYAEECASMLGVTFSSGSQRDIVTTDWMSGAGKGCTEGHTGTSAAAPLAAGMIALMLEARSCLSWRDVQYIIILTCQKIDLDLAHYQDNGAGLSHSHKHGFGLLDSWRLVNAAKVWETVPWLTSYSYMDSSFDKVIPKGPDSPLTVVHTVTDTDVRGLGLLTLENVQLTVWLSHPYRGKIGVTLTSPAGTTSVLAAPRPLDNSSAGFTDWTFTTVRCWGEQALGNWTIQFFDTDKKDYGNGIVNKFRLTLFGTPMTSEEFAGRRSHVQAAMSGEFLHKNFSLPCQPPQKYAADYVPVSDRILKIILLSGAFCLAMAIYETFEYIFCYNDEKKEARQQRRLSEQARRLASNTLDDSNTPALSEPPVNGANSSINMVLDDDDDEEDDVFYAMETSSLLNKKDTSHAGNYIPLKTLSRREVEDVEMDAVGAHALAHGAAQASSHDLDTSGS